MKICCKSLNVVLARPYTSFPAENKYQGVFCLRVVLYLLKLMILESCLSEKQEILKILCLRERNLVMAARRTRSPYYPLALFYILNECDMSRAYVVNGEKYPSVTTILSVIRKPFLERWRGNLGNHEADRVSREAADYGTAVHAALHAINLGEKLQVEENISILTDAYEQWKEEHIERVISSEIMVANHDLRYAGTADALVQLRGDSFPTILDYKTSNYVGKEWALQLSAYREALLAEYGSIRRMILQFPKKDQAGELYIHEYTNHDTDWNAFMAAHTLWHMLEGKTNLVAVNVEPSDTTVAEQRLL